MNLRLQSRSRRSPEPTGTDDKAIGFKMRDGSTVAANAVLVAVAVGTKTNIELVEQAGAIHR